MNDEAHCPRHPGNPVVAICSRCGTFLCSDDLQLLDAKTYCAECVARPDVDYLEAFRLKYWGKRDGWAWVAGFGGLTNLALAAVAATALVREAMPRASVADLGAVVALGLLGAGVCFAFFAGVPWARPALLALPVLSGLVAGATDGASAAASSLVPFLIALAIFADTRNKLFFKVEVPRARLQKTWNLYANNTLARYGLSLSFAGLLLPLFAPFGLALSIVGLTRVDPKAHPPIGRKGQAIAGIALGAIGLVWGGYLALSLFRDGN